MDEQVLSSSPDGSPEHVVLPGIAQLFRESWDIFTSRFRTFVAIALIPAASFAILFGALAALTLWAPNALLESSVAAFIFLVTLAVVTVAAVIFVLWSQVALLVAVRDHTEGIGIIEAFRRSKTKLVSYFWISLLACFVVLGGFFLFIIPGIIVAVSVTFAIYVLLTDDVRGMDALVRSREYVRGRWGSVFWRFFVAIVVIFAVSFLAQFIAAITGSEVFVGIFSATLSILTTPFMFIYFFQLFHQVKSTRNTIDPQRLEKKMPYIYFLIPQLA